MSIFRRPGPRFVAEAIAIVLAAAIPGVEHLAWWEIGACVAVVLLGAIFLESSLSRPGPAQAPAVPPEPAPHVRVLPERPLGELVPPVPEPEPEPDVVEAPIPEPEPEPVAVAVAEPPPVAPAGGPWNVWELERLLRESGNSDTEKTFLLHYLRDYAGPDGLLPAEFDDLVRESFGTLL